ncbi:hypothetical protein ACFFRR_005210 [Megaselia abdita]
MSDETPPKMIAQARPVGSRRLGRLTLGGPFLKDKKGVTIAEMGPTIIDDWEIRHCISGLMTNILKKGPLPISCSRTDLKMVIKPWEGNSTPPDTQHYVDFKGKWRIYIIKFKSVFLSVCSL